MTIQKILILLDLGEETPSLLAYGRQLARTLEADVWLQHVYYLPPAMEGELFIPAEALQEYERQLHEQLTSLQKPVAEQLGRSVQYEVSFGELATEMNRLIAREHIDLVVMGNRGRHFSDNVLGSSTLKVIHRATCPVLSVPSPLPFHPYRRIALATDWKETSLSTTSWLVGFAHQCQAHLDIIHFRRRDEVIGGELSIERALSLVPNTFYSPHNHDIEEGLQRHVKQHHDDLIVLIPRTHGFFDRLFQQSVTRQVVYHTQMPLLTLPA
ncbi:MAG: universal stress protein [Tunicatimonas sp.]